MLNAIAIAFSAVATIAGAQVSEELPVKNITATSRVEVQKDGTFEEVRSYTRLVVLRQGLNWAKRDSITFSTSAQKGEILEAYTLKADGRRIDVRADSYQIEINQGLEAGKPAYSDQTTISVAFPLVEVGDSTVFKTRIVTATPIFVGHFSDAAYFGKERPFGEALTTYDWPADMPMRYRVVGCETVPGETKPGRRAVAIKCTNPDFKRSKRKDWTVRDHDAIPGIMISSHPDYESIATSYWKQAAPLLVVSDRIKALAKTILADAGVDPLEGPPTARIRALYDWVSLNITYASNCIGIGTHKPRALDWVLDQKMGDCKDHAQLLHALLTTQGIVSTQALVNAGASYKLAEIPVVGAVNHVINYIPSLNLFLDSTATGTPYGSLPPSLFGKPVLLTEGFDAGLSIPLHRADSSWQTLKGTITIAQDGTATGDVTVKLGGIFAVQVRDSLRDLTPEQEKRYVNDPYDRDGTGRGWAKVTSKDDPKPMLSTFNYRMQFAVPDFIQKSTGAVGLYAPISTPAAPTMLAVGSQEESGAPQIACFGGRSSEEVTFILPKNRSIISVPKDITVKTPLLTFEAKYKRTGNKVVVNKTYLDSTPGPVCDETIQKQYRDMAKRVDGDARAQLLYR